MRHQPRTKSWSKIVDQFSFFRTDLISCCLVVRARTSLSACDRPQRNRNYQENWLHYALSFGRRFSEQRWGQWRLQLEHLLVERWRLGIKQWSSHERRCWRYRWWWLAVEQPDARHAERCDRAIRMAVGRSWWRVATRWSGFPAAGTTTSSAATFISSPQWPMRGAEDEPYSWISGFHWLTRALSCVICGES